MSYTKELSELFTDDTIRLSFVFDQSYKSKIYRLGFAMTARNNSWCGAGYYDGGSAPDVFASVGQWLKGNLKSM